MPNDMPVELLREVFDIALHVPDHLFFDTTTNSPFAHVQASTSNLLIVCKRWLKIATPAFYETLILRSRAQILSLCSAIAANPQFAIRIRRMRVEGRFHDFIGDTAKHMTALHAVCFAFDAEYITKMPGVVKLLRAVNPRIAAFPTILHTSFATSNKVNKMVGDAIRKWKICTHSFFHTCTPGIWTVSPMSCSALPQRCLESHRLPLLSAV
ncbi:hypothetical protein BKA62DRAFT_127333 [Auriculariales sp. MPI-PUGE-AT-0066]|nr:hypothetical protein BKA62DRAFT_127333 [Auriculariales sp. MPI-PUGE-AT-0066]